ncbi:unnamed protein product [Pleuronectes platessa]|uniref:Uncharacterized protein n=1 Tax=Pleuronectes platessa TaxID=8262 RepID=A0A9N7V346_PLEPL|nr:unnamed protein product [Pleuronectes platessa]
MELHIVKTSNQKSIFWEEEFSDPMAQQNDILRLEVHDEDLIFADLLGVCQRHINKGTHEIDCYLEKGGTLQYTYSLN